jgi:hypothetical protein
LKLCRVSGILAFFVSKKTQKIGGFAMSIKIRYFFDSEGHEFESEVLDIVSLFARREWGASAVRFSTEYQDRFEGTDLFVLGIPIDVTLAFDRKNRTRKLGTINLDGITIDFGIRFGNGKANFDTPVLVIGAGSCLGITLNNMWVALETIKSNIHKILNIGMDKYLLAIED